MENTKEYICRAMVTVVDHLGNVSSNLEGLISHTNAFSDAEIRIQCLKQVSAITCTNALIYIYIYFTSSGTKYK
jgi:hypothetical protein